MSYPARAEGLGKYHYQSAWVMLIKKHSTFLRVAVQCYTQETRFSESSFCRWAVGIFCTISRPDTAVIWPSLYTRMSQRFCNILVTRRTISKLLMLLLMLWRWRTTLNCKISNSPDTLLLLLTGFISMAWSMVEESTFLRLPDLTLSSTFLWPEWYFFNQLVVI